MGTLTATKSKTVILEEILREYLEILNSNRDTISSRLFIDPEQQRYLIVTEGWEGQKRIHSLIFDAEICHDQIWLHHDGLDHGITSDLLAAGIPADQVVLAFHPPVTIQGVTEECGFQALKILDWYGLSCFGLRSKG
ncbi:MAG: element excision factor XisI family protein [Prochlorothrix sp.]